MRYIHFSKVNPRFLTLLFLSIIITLVVPAYYVSTAKADAVFSSQRVNISDSRASATPVQYDFWMTASATTSIKQIDIKVCTQAGAFGDTCTAPTGLSLTSAARSADNIAGTGRTDSSPAVNQYRTVITTPSTQSAAAMFYKLTTITNPSTTNTTFYVRTITYSDTGTTTIDTGQVAYAILTSTSLAVSATVDPTLTFSLAAATTGTVNSATITVTTGTSASTIPLGTLASGAPSIAAHDATVTTNATSGYTVTASASATPPLVFGANDIDAFSGTNASPTTWSAPAGSSANVNTGYFGYTTEDASLGTGTATRFTSSGGNKWAGTTTNGEEVIYSATGVSAQTTRLGWQGEVNALQPAGSYTGTVILIATPTY